MIRREKYMGVCSSASMNPMVTVVARERTANINGAVDDSSPHRPYDLFSVTLPSLLSQKEYPLSFINPKTRPNTDTEA